MKLNNLAANIVLAASNNALALGITYPNGAVVWHVGEKTFVDWDGSCAEISTTSSINIDLLDVTNGNKDIHITTLGTISCSPGVNRLNVTVPNVAPGSFYAVKIAGSRRDIYSDVFKIDNKTSLATFPATSTPTASETSKSNANSSDSGVSPRLIGGIIAGVAMMVIIVVFFVMRNRRKNNNTSEGKEGGHCDEIPLEEHPELEVKSSEPSPFMDTQRQTFNQTAMQGQQDHTQLQDVTRDGYQGPQQQYIIQLSRHPRPNMAITIGGEDESGHQQPLPVWEPKPFVPSPSREEPSSLSPPSGPQPLPRPSDPQALPRPSDSQALSRPSDPQTLPHTDPQASHWPSDRQTPPQSFDSHT